MSQPLKSFEGPDVKALLARIRREVGPDAEISGAEKIRIGGLLGFFAKEQYRVLVKVPEPSGVLRPVESERRRQSARPRRRGRQSGDVAAPSAQLQVIFRDEEVTAPVPVVGATQRDVFEILADATDDVNEVTSWGGTLTAPAAAHAGPDDESFESVLSRIATTLDSPLPTRPAALQTEPAALHAEMVPEDPGAMPVVPVGAAHLADQSSPVLAADYLGGTPASPGLAPDAMGAPDPGTIHVRDLLGTSLASEAARFLATSTGGAVRHDTLESLRRTGMDGALLRSASEVIGAGRGVQSSLLEVFGGIPTAPPLPRLAGSLLVVAGAGLRATGLAETLAVEIGVDPGEVAYATLAPEAVTAAAHRRVIRTAEEAGELAPGWRRSGVALVAVDVPLTASHRPWAAHLISALRPTLVWGSVDATCKADDVRAWAQDLGGLDALALENLDSTVSPVAVLEAGIPVARLDGRPASAARWTATVVDRISPCT